MDGWEILKQAGELERRGQAFALATVVWRQGPSSSQQNARTIITAEGERLTPAGQLAHLLQYA